MSWRARHSAVRSVAEIPRSKSTRKRKRTCVNFADRACGPERSGLLVRQSTRSGRFIRMRKKWFQRNKGDTYMRSRGTVARSRSDRWGAGNRKEKPLSASYSIYR